MARDLVIRLVGDASSLERAFKDGARSAKRFDSSMSKTQSRTKRSFGGMRRSVFGLAAAFVGPVGLTVAAKAAFTEMAEAQKVTAQTNAVLKSTGKAAKVSAKQVERLAESLMTKSGVDDEVIQSGENVLLTFRDIRNETGKGNKIFDEATKATLDMSVALGRDMSDSAIQVGKALNDPIKGVTALRRVGVQFTDAQQEQIKALTESGKKLEAQKIILKELQVEFGGSAEAAGKTLPGKLNILRNTVLNLSAKIATLLTPAITKLVDTMVAWLSKSKNQKAVLDTVKAAASAVKDVVLVLKTAFDGLNAITGSTKNTFKLLLAAFITFKALALAAYIAKMATAMRAFAVASAAATAANAGGVPGGAGGRFGKVLGAVGAVAVGAPLVAGAIRKIPGWDKTMNRVGAGIYDATHGHRNRPVQVNVQVDGRTIARALTPPIENRLAHRNNQRDRSRRVR